MADHSKPTVASTYSNFVAELEGRLDDLACGLDPAVVSPSNLPTGAIRWSSAAGWWQKWSGSAWGAVASIWKIPGSLLVGSTTALMGEILRVSPASGTDGTIALFGYSGGANNPYLRIVTSDSERLSTIAANASTGSAALALAANSVEGLRLLANGNVGIGTTAPQTRLHVASAATSTRVRVSNSGAAYAELYADTNGVLAIDADPSNASAAQSLRLRVGGTERVRLDAAGNLLIGKTDAGNVNAGGVAYLGRANYVSAGGTVAAFYNAAAAGAQVGSISISTTATSYATSSDHRLKTPLQPMADAVERVLALRPGYHGWLAAPEVGLVPGWYAHELAEVVPTAVTGTKDAVDEHGAPVYQAVDNSKVVPLLAAALQQALQRLAVLESRLTPEPA